MDAKAFVILQVGYPILIILFKMAPGNNLNVFKML